MVGNDATGKPNLATGYAMVVVDGNVLGPLGGICGVSLDHQFVVKKDVQT